MKSNINFKLDPDGLDKLAKQVASNIESTGVDVTCPKCGKASKLHSNEFQCPHCGHKMYVEFRM